MMISALFLAAVLAQEPPQDDPADPFNDPVEIFDVDETALQAPVRDAVSTIPGAELVVTQAGELVGNWRRIQECNDAQDAEGHPIRECFDVILRTHPDGTQIIAAAGSTLATGFMKTGRGEELIRIPPPRPQPPTD